MSDPANATIAPQTPPAARSAGWHMADGTIRVFLSEMLIVPVGLLIAAYLTRTFRPDGYGLYASAIALATWLEVTISIVFSRATIKAIGDAVGEGRDWRPVAATAVHQQFYASVATAAALFALAEPIALALHKPAVAGYLRLACLNLPLFALAQAHRDVLIGTGRFRGRALTSAGRWLSRLALVVGLVAWGFGVEGAIVGLIAASVVDLLLCRWQVARAPADLPAGSMLPLGLLFRRSSFSARQFWTYIGPLFWAAISLRIFDRLDLFMIQILGGTDEQTGWYAAAQNLSLLPTIFAASFSPLLLSTLTRLRRSGEEQDQQHARNLARQSLRWVICLIPLGGIVAGSASEIVCFVSGPAYARAGEPLAGLIFCALGLMMISTASALLIAADRPRWTIVISAPLPAIALIGHLLLIPRCGPRGAAISSAVTAALGAGLALAIVWRFWRITPPPLTLLRNTVLCAAAYYAATHWRAQAGQGPLQGPRLILKLLLLTIAVAVALLATGEFAWPWRRRPDPERSE